MKPSLAVAAGLLFSWPLAVAAQPVTGPYVGAGAGINLFHDTTTRGFRIHDDDIGFVGLGSLGWGFGNGIRAEVEGNYRESEIDRITGPTGRVGSSGYIRNYGVMGNALFDFDLSSFGIRPDGFMPYIGVGAGYAWTDIKNARLNIGGGYRLDDSDGNFAYQAILGAAWGLGGAIPGLSVTSEVRYFSTLNPTLRLDRNPGATGAGVPGSLKPDNDNLSVLLGVRYALLAPHPAPAAVAAPVAPPTPSANARTYLVFFDWNRADLTSRAREIIGEAAQNARRASPTRIEVAGHADRSGTPQYNQRLSQRRAEVVASELVARGISREEIGVTAFGESRPLVPTADGVREQQNRRVEIVLR